MNTNEVLNKLIAEINRRIDAYNASIEKYAGKQKSIKAERDSWKWAECKWFLSLITSLQQEQPEVDLEKALDKYYKNADFGPSEAIEYEIHKDIARHFYELGLNSKK